MVSSQELQMSEPKTELDARAGVGRSDWLFGTAKQGRETFTM